MGSNVTPKGPPDGHDLPLAMKWASFVGMGLLVRIFSSWQGLCIYPCVRTCAFVLQPNYFSKNHASVSTQVQTWKNQIVPAKSSLKADNADLVRVMLDDGGG